MSRFLLMIMLLAACLTSACGQIQTQQSAYYQREQVVRQHVDYPQLEAGRQEYAKLVDQQKKYQERFRVQLACLQDLQELEALSRADYIQADIQTRIAEYVAREDYALGEYYKDLDRKVELVYGPSREALDAQAKNELFNLRLKLHVMHLKPEKRALLEEEYLNTRRDREQDLETWKQKRDNYYQEELAGYYQDREARIATKEEELRSRMGLTPIRATSFADQLASAPAYIQKIFIDLEQKLNQQRAANLALEQRIDQDVEQALGRLTQAQGYRQVLTVAPKQGQAVDITQAIITEMKKNKDK